MTTELIGKVGRDARLEAHLKSCHSDDGDNDDDNEHSDDDTDEENQLSEWAMTHFRFL